MQARSEQHWILPAQLHITWAKPEFMTLSHLHPVLPYLFRDTKGIIKHNPSFSQLVDLDFVYINKWELSSSRARKEAVLRPRQKSLKAEDSDAWFFTWSSCSPVPFNREYPTSQGKGCCIFLTDPLGKYMCVAGCGEGTSYWERIKIHCKYHHLHSAHKVTIIIYFLPTAEVWNCLASSEPGTEQPDSIHWWMLIEIVLLYADHYKILIILNKTKFKKNPKTTKKPQPGCCHVTQRKSFDQYFLCFKFRETLLTDWH